MAEEAQRGKELGSKFYRLAESDESPYGRPIPNVEFHASEVTRTKLLTRVSELQSNGGKTKRKVSTAVGHTPTTRRTLVHMATHREQLM